MAAGWRAAAATAIAGRIPAVASTSGLDRALVCIYLFGGNDSNNLIVPLDRTQYAAYARIRGNLALSLDSLLPVTAARSQTQYGFHPALAELRDLWNSRALAVVANVGSLAEPVSKRAYRARTAMLPEDLMVHKDASLRYLPEGFAVPGWTAHMPGAFTFDSGLSLASPEGLPLPGEQRENALLRRVMAGDSPAGTPFPATGIGRQLRQVSSLLPACARMGMSRQIFLCSLSGFDTHSDQPSRQARLWRELSAGLSAFYQATLELGVEQRVTTFTATEFNRTMQPNAKNGTEHGWGGHQLVLGGAVLGGDVYGEFPAPAMDGPDDAGHQGIWIPTTSRDQYEAALARWFGVPFSDLTALFPRLGAFPATPALGFLV